MAIDHMKYPLNGGFFVDSKYQSIVQQTLFYNSIFQPGATFSERYSTGPAGQIFVPKLTSKAVELSTPALDFKHEDAEDILIQISLNNSFRRSRKMRGIQDVAVQFPMVARYAELATKEVREAWNLAGIACLITESFTSTVKTADFNEDTAKRAILSAKTEMYKKKTTPKWVLCTPDAYQAVLSAAGKYFTPVTNDRMVYDGDIGHWLGLNFINCNLMQSGTALGARVEYYDYASTKKTISDDAMKNLNFIMYDAEALSIVTNFNVTRAVTAIDFVGSYIQVDINSGFRVTEQNAVCVGVQK